MPPAKTDFKHTKETLKLLEDLLKCCECHTFASSPVTLGGCEHIFCSSCCKTYLGGSCPICEIPADAKDAEVDRQLFNMATLCRRLRRVLSTGVSGEEEENMDRNEAEGQHIQCTPNQPIQGSVIHDNLVTVPCQTETEQSEDKGRTSQKAVSCDETKSDVTETDEEVGMSRTRRKARQKSEGKGELNVTESNTESKVDSAQRKQLPVAQKKLQNHRNSRMKKEASNIKSNVESSKRRRKSLPPEQTSMTQFYEHDDEDNEHDDETLKDAVSKGKLKNQKQNVTRTVDETQITKLRQSLDSRGDELSSTSVSEDSVTAASNEITGRRSSRNKLKPTTSSMESPKLASPAAKTPVSRTPRSTAKEASAQKTPVSAHSKSKVKVTSIPGTPVSVTSSKKQQAYMKGQRTPQGRQLVGSKLFNSPVLNKRNAKGETALHVAAIKNDVTKVGELLNAGANPNMRDNAGWTPLHEACNHGYVDVARLLLDSSAMINIPGLENDTPLHDAINNGRMECVKLLMSRGASLTLRNMHGQTAQDLAVSEGMKAVLRTPVTRSSSTGDTEPMDMLEFQRPCLLGTSLSRDEKIILQKGTSQLQVKLLDEVTPEVTHVITTCNSEGMCPRTIKLLLAILTGKWILNMEWLETCIQVGSLVCEEAFEVQGLSLFPNSQAPYRGRINRKQQLPGLFDGCMFYFHGSFEYATPSKEDLINIIKTGGGKLLSREPKPGHLDELIVTVPFHADVTSDMADCGVFLVHETQIKYTPIRTKRMCSVPASWIMDSVANFKLLTLPELSG